jgi:hypothetical protein
MATFIVRVELHATPDYTHPHYEQLHTAIEKAGFTRKLHPDAGSYQLQTGTYKMESDHSLETVLDLAKKATDSVDTNNSVIAMEMEKYAWVGPKA